MSNHGWYEIHDAKKRKKIIESNLITKIVMSEPGKKSQIVKVCYNQSSLLVTGSLQSGFVDNECKERLRSKAEEIVNRYETKLLVKNKK